MRRLQSFLPSSLLVALLAGATGCGSGVTLVQPLDAAADAADDSADVVGEDAAVEEDASVNDVDGGPADCGTADLDADGDAAMCTTN